MTFDRQDCWFNATAEDGTQARIVAGSFGHATALKATLEKANVRCGITSTVTIHFVRDDSELARAMKILDLIFGAGHEIESMNRP